MLLKSFVHLSFSSNYRILHRPYSAIMSNNQLKNRLVWIDLEMTGLDDTKDHILEAACLVTDENLNIVAEGPSIVIHQPSSILESMNEWCIKTHTESGLVEASRQSKIRLESAENEILDFVRQHTNPGECPLAGNSVGEDKRFLNRYMPKLVSHLHYRIVDVSTIKELCRRWYPETIRQVPTKALTHRALDDIKESIAELKFYRSTIFK